MPKKSDDSWEYVEVKTGKARKTKSQKEFKEEVEKKGGKYVEKRIDTYDLFD